MLKKLFDLWFPLEYTILIKWKVNQLWAHVIAGVLLAVPVQLIFGRLWLTCVLGAALGLGKRQVNIWTKKGGAQWDSPTATALGAAAAAAVTAFLCWAL